MGEKEIETTEAIQKNPGKRTRFNYRWIVRNVPFFLFLTGLAVVYIYNGHKANKTIFKINKVNRELKELQYEYKTLQSDVMFKSKQSQLAQAVKGFGLKEIINPPVVLKDSLEIR